MHKLLNPDGLLPEISESLKPAKKSKSLWARRLTSDETVETLEGTYVAQAGDYLCRGIAGEFWAQKLEKITSKYTQSGVSEEGWERFDPNPDSPPVQAAAIEFEFAVHASWGELKGKPGDYIVQDPQDETDVWIVDKAIFEASYEFVTG